MKSSKFVVPALLTPYASFEHYGPLCAGVEPVSCNAPLPVVMANIDAAFRALEPRLHEVAALMPKFDLNYVLEMPNLVRGVLYAAGRVTTPASTGEIAEKLALARKMREPMLTIAEGLAVMHPEPLLPPERVAKIRAGKGPYDTATDVTDLVGLYREFARELTRKHPFDAAWLDEAERLGLWLMQHITPEGAAKPSVRGSEAAAIRDRLWAALLLRDVKLRVLAQVLFESEADAMVPALHARVVSRAQPEADPEPAPIA